MSTLRTRLTILAVAGALGAVGTIASAAAASAAPAAAPHRCGNGALAVTATYTEAGAGHRWFSLVYRNTTTSTCTVYGYPGLDAVSSHGTVLAHAARTPYGYGSGASLQTVTIRPGGFASAGVEYLGFDPRTTRNCPMSAAIETIVANTTRAVRLPVSVGLCRLQVHPTTAGVPMYPGYGSAQAQWIAGSKVASAYTNRYLLRAEHDLQITNDYPTQVQELAQLISLPETSLTAQQIKEARADVAALDRFFVTPGLYN